MNWNNVQLILKRELRDQARDRRTLFSVIGLPVLLYPLMGLMVLQVMQFRQANPARIQVIGLAELPDAPELIVPIEPAKEGETSQGTRYEFSSKLLDDAGINGKFTIEATEASIDSQVVEKTAKESLHSEGFDAIIYFPPGFKERMESFQDQMANGAGDVESKFPSPQLITNSSEERSTLANNRLRQILHAWRERVIQKNLEANNVPTVITDPFRIDPLDLSEKPRDQATYMWAKIFPFIVVIWALTGAFYPAIDLCAGEKERGTLETLLSSPALRSEIVAGKLLAIMTFSMATSVLNLLSMGFTASFVMGQFGNGQLNFGPPPIWSLGWLFLALIPMAALFSALALAIATMARSSKEGQYYLLPLLMLNLPLVVLPVLPDTQLTFGTSLIPVSGMSFLLKSLMEGDYRTAALYALPVLGVTAFCIWVAIRWAIDQFNNESVLFSESERFNLQAWLKKVWRDRQATPTAAGAFVMGIVLLALPHMLGKYIAPEVGPDGKLGTSALIQQMLTIQIGLILLPVLIAAAIFTRSMAKTFLLRMPDRQMMLGVLLAPLLAICLHPFALYLRGIIQSTIPMSQDLQDRLQDTLGGIENLPIWAIFVMFGVLPAICEEFACRGFILSGMRHIGHKWAAISISAIFFGLLHGILQQSIPATIFGLLIGFVAVQTRSLLPAILFHATHNCLVFAQGMIVNDTLKDFWPLRFLVASVTDTPGDAEYHPILVGLCALGAFLIVGVFARMPAELSVEERRQAALDHQGRFPNSASKSKDAGSTVS
ncbi:CPBP family intramembrane metalloprotease [Bremerella cremea]|uniref:CPBP family intramembrane metalloprotease n=1 Tax=Bremerella cremea TaxID=1031537 RepID=A0A368KZ75_9BACT|nr:ABC transporter permease subunit/CPBP intramembrane protease [Bremerella cremea]RCS54702.1 CPBP family intramembrane metalloprotease [Bremerella cremea]